LCHFARGQEAVVEIAWLGRDRQREGWLGQALDVTRDQTVGREIYDAVIGERHAFDSGFAGVAAEMDVGQWCAEFERHRLEFVGRFRKLRQGLAQLRPVDPGTLPGNNVFGLVFYAAWATIRRVLAPIQ
jgi:hypothetical protein